LAKASGRERRGDFAGRRLALYGSSHELLTFELARRFAALRRGFAGRRSIVLPELVWKRSPNQSPRHGERIDLLVWHETAGSYAGSVAWLCNPRAAASAHIVVREDGNEATQLVALREKAWHAAYYNSHASASSTRT
jgi:hypothetical protein